MNALVTGGTGFVGKPLVRRLLQDGWHVTLLTRDRERARDIDGGNLTVYEGDVSDSEATDRVARLANRFDAVFHLAASLSYFGEREELYRTNVQGTRNVLSLAIESRAKKFIYASSIEAAGPVTRKQVPASPDGACKPVSPYGVTKVLAERLVMSAARGHFPAAALRIGNVYGPDHLSFVSEIAEAILQRNRLLEFLPIYADRYIHPVHNDDVTRGILAAYWSDAPSCTVTLAGEYATVGDLFQICAEFLGKQIRPRQRRKTDEIYLLLRREYHRRSKTADFITYLMAGPGKRIHRAYSLEETRRALGFSPQVTLRNGVTQTLRRAKDAGLSILS
jgi:dihydroflavonol-4-reductase